jgi:4-hydroxythreonine-4-phosphate dehydrogenase
MKRLKMKRLKMKRLKNRMTPLPTLIITPGDITGIGPEITAKLLCQPERWHNRCELLVIGSKHALQRASQHVAQQNFQRGHKVLPEAGWQIIDMLGESPGEISYRALERAVLELASHRAAALVTGPISKHRLQQALMPLTSGHTEILASQAKNHWPSELCIPNMAFVYEQFRLLLLTRHVPLSEVSSTLNIPDVAEALRQLCQWLTRNFKIQAPRVGILGVNPHGGEIGGHEERNILLPAMAIVQAEFPMVVFSGPLAADAAFRGFDPKNPTWDAIVAPAHDQGLIPMKLLGGLQAVQVTLGLPFIRTSVSHGTAEDIAGKGEADAESLFAALEVALAMI